MHLLVREMRSLDEAEAAFDPGPSSADLVFLSFSDSDLGGWGAAWTETSPSLRLLNLARLLHPMSVDLLVEQVIAPARCVVARLLGGIDYWRYGVEEIAAACRVRGIALALVPGDGPADPRLVELSTIDPGRLARMDGFLRHGGPGNAGHALALAAHLAGLTEDDWAEPEILADAGLFALDGMEEAGRALAVIVFYRSHLTSGDTGPVVVLAGALFARGMSVRALYCSSLKEPSAASFVRDCLRAWAPAVVLSATGFSARREDGLGSPLDAGGVPVLQVVLAVGGFASWEASFRGVSQTDLAMQVVLPELDGRLLTTAISFKAAMPVGVDQVRTINRPDAEGIALAADRAAGWTRLSGTERGKRRVAIVLSDYPGLGGQIAHAVGLDTFASLHAMLRRLGASGYDAPAPESVADLAEALCHGEPDGFLSLADYAALRAQLPDALNRALDLAWGDPGLDEAVVDGAFRLRHLRLGRIVVAVQPDRGSRQGGRRAGYHDADLPPRHLHVAFHLWLRVTMGVHAVVHLGTHGSLEWLPGKAAALSATCWPVALLRGMPVIYPFIVNNPGEAAVAKRRLGAVTIGHLTPVMTAAGGAAPDLERLIDEYAAAAGLDRRRGAMLRGEILSRAADLGLLAEAAADQTIDEDEALARLDAWLCDIKDLQIRDGLHVFGEPTRTGGALRDAILAGSPEADPASLDAALDECAGAEMRALLDALDGRFVEPGPAGAPSRGRRDVLPTGRNLFAIDPRAVPTRAAMELAGRMAETLLARHAQEHGDFLRSLVIDLWGNTTLRTGGEDLALALVLIGAAPVWDEGSSRVRGIEIVPTALLDRPRVDVTLRVSGLFRDQFESQMLLFDEAVRAIAAREECADLNPLSGLGEFAPARIYGPAPGLHGAGSETLLAGGDREALGQAYLAASSNVYGRDRNGASDESGFAARVRASQALLHQQDHAETDLLDSPEYAAHEGGYAAAAAMLGATPALYHADSSRPLTPRLRTVAEEVRRVTRGRVANPVWITGMMRHGYRGASEIARALTSLHGFARTLPDRFDAQFDLMFDATLADPDVERFLHDCNPQALREMQADFRNALSRDLWRPKANSVARLLDG